MSPISGMLIRQARGSGIDPRQGARKNPARDKPAAGNRITVEFWQG
jgi:hypothetical protein